MRGNLDNFVGASGKPEITLVVDVRRVS